MLVHCSQQLLCCLTRASSRKHPPPKPFLNKVKHVSRIADDCSHVCLRWCRHHPHEAVGGCRCTVWCPCLHHSPGTSTRSHVSYPNKTPSACHSRMWQYCRCCNPLCCCRIAPAAQSSNSNLHNTHRSELQREAQAEYPVCQTLSMGTPHRYGMSLAGCRPSPTCAQRCPRRRTTRASCQPHPVASTWCDFPVHCIS